MSEGGNNRVVAKLLVFLMLLSPVAIASDSLRTVSEMGHRVFNNLNIADTIEGHARLDSGTVRRCIRDATVDVGTLLPTPKAKTITTTSGTFGYLVDTHLDSVQAAFVKGGRWAKLLPVVPWYKLIEAYSQMGLTYDTTSIEYAAVNGDSLYLYPVPASGDSIYVFYTTRGSTPTAAADTIDVPHELYSAVEYLATVKAAMIEQNLPAIQIFNEAYAQEIAKFIGGKKPQ